MHGRVCLVGIEYISFDYKAINHFICMYLIWIDNNIIVVSCSIEYVRIYAYGRGCHVSFLLIFHIATCSKFVHCSEFFPVD